MFWISLLGLAYIYLGYPLLMRGLARVRPMRRQRQASDQKVSVVIACHNEAAAIVPKLRALLSGDQAAWVDEVLIGLDGSTDGTGDAVSSLNDGRIRVVRFAERRGKPSVLNDLIPQCRSGIVVLCDARQMLSETAIPELVANFADPTVGVVSGELKFRADSETTVAGRGIGAYWRIEKMIRRAEAGFRGVPGATGALYAIRRELFTPIPPQTLLDDVVIPMQAVSRGYRCVFETGAVAWDDAACTLSSESIRKRRTIAGAAQLAIRHPRWLLPWCNPIWFEYVSHKILRLTSPLLLLLVMATNIMLLTEPVYAVLGTLHAVFYGTALAGWICQRTGRPSLLFGVQLMFLTLNVTTALALWDAARGRFRVTWQRSAVDRPCHPAGPQPSPHFSG